MPSIFCVRSIGAATALSTTVIRRQAPALVELAQNSRQPARRCLSDQGEGPKTRQVQVVKKKKKAAKKSTGGRDRVTELLLSAVDAPCKPVPPASEEEMARRREIGKNYVIGKFKRHNAINHDLSCKLKMKNHAIDMLPRGTMWKEAALVQDDFEGPPLSRHIAVDTPPIPGYNAADFIAKEDQ